MQLLRIVRKSNDKFAVIGMILLAVTALSLLFFVMVAWNSDPIPASVGGLLSVLFAGTAIYLLSGIVFPYESEFVMESEGFRFGREDRPGEQRRIARSRIKCLILDLGPDESLCIFTGGSGAPHLAAGIIVTKAQMAAVAEAVGKHWPDIPVHDRETFQSISSSKNKSLDS